MNTINIEQFTEEMNKEYGFLYSNYDHVAGYREALEWGDKFLSDDSNGDFIGQLIDYRHDFISSDREVVAFAFAMQKYISDEEYYKYC